MKPERLTLVVVAGLAALVAIFVLASIACAGDEPPVIAENVLVSQWRAGSSAFHIGWAHGATVGAWWMDCRESFSVGELHAYMMYGADPNKAIVVEYAGFLGRHGCVPSHLLRDEIAGGR